jgi:sporulation protein YlmC with PRC-barrel domain
VTDLVRLSDLVGRQVHDPAGRRLGRVADLEAAGADRFPPVTAAVLSDGRRVAWAALEPEGRGFGVPEAGSGPAPPDALLLGRDVLDAQVVDVAGRRLARVGEVLLAGDGGELRVVAVDVGLGPVAWRLGLRPLARRLADDRLAWDGLYLASGAGHRIQLAHRAQDVHRLSEAELMAIVARLPPARGAEVLGIARPGRHEAPVEVARAAGRPGRRFRVMRARRRAPS